MRSSKCALLLLLGLLIVGQSLATAAPSTLKTTVSPGTTQLTVAGKDFLITTDQAVVVYFIVDGSSVTGAVEPAAGTQEAFVTIILLDESDETVIYSGKVSQPTPFDSLQPHETGHVDS